MSKLMIFITLLEKIFTVVLSGIIVYILSHFLVKYW